MARRPAIFVLAAAVLDSDLLRYWLRHFRLKKSNENTETVHQQRRQNSSSDLGRNLWCVPRHAFGSSPQASPALSRRWRPVQNLDLCWIRALSAHWTDLRRMYFVGTSKMLPHGAETTLRLRNMEGLRCPDPCPAWPGLSNSDWSVVSCWVCVGWSLRLSCCRECLL